MILIKNYIQHIYIYYENNNIHIAFIKKLNYSEISYIYIYILENKNLKLVKLLNLSTVLTSKSNEKYHINNIYISENKSEIYIILLYNGKRDAYTEYSNNLVSLYNDNKIKAYTQMKDDTSEIEITNLYPKK